MMDGMKQPRPSALPWLIPLLAVFFLLSLFYHYTVPLFEAPDEPAHLEYLAFLHSEKKIPFHSANPDVPAEGLQPPLYYLIAWPVFALVVDDAEALYQDLHRVDQKIYGYTNRPSSEINGDLVRLRTSRSQHSGPRRFEDHPHLAALLQIRWISLLFGMLAVGLTYLGLLRFNGHNPVAFLGAGLLAFNPQFLFVCNYINNDAVATAIGAAAFYLVATRLVPTQPKAKRGCYLLAGLILGIAFLSKMTVFPGLAVAIAAIVLTDTNPRTVRLQNLGLLFAVAAFVASPYAIWKMAHYGDPLGLAVDRAANALLPGPDQFGGFWPYFSTIYWDWTSESYWGWFGWMNLRIPKAAYLVFFMLSWTGLLGFLLSLRRRASVVRNRFHIYLVASILLSVAAHIWFNMHVVQAQGRHLFPVAPQISSLLALGFGYLAAGGRASRIGACAAIGIVLCLLGMAVYCLVGVINPAYAVQAL